MCNLFHVVKLTYTYVHTYLHTSAILCVLVSTYMYVYKHAIKAVVVQSMRSVYSGGWLWLSRGQCTREVVLFRYGYL